VTRRRLGRVGAGAALVSVALTLLGIGLQIVQRDPIDPGLVVMLAVVGVAYPVVGARIVRAEPWNAVGWLLVGAGVSWAFTLATGGVVALAIATGGSLASIAAPIAWVGTWSWMPGAAMLLIFVPLVFPNGKLASPRWRWFVLLVVVVVAIDALVHAVLALGHLDDAAYLVGLFDAASEPGPLGAMAGVVDGWLILSLVSVGSILLRLRRSVGVERQQIRWFAWALAIAAVLLITDSAVFQVVGGPLSIVAVTIIPASLAIAILRYRLYDLDRLVSRTIAYGLVTGTLVVTYGGLILLLGGPLGSFASDDTLSIALATLGVAALFQPVRRRIQGAVDRRFDRARYDGDQTAAAFSARMRDAHDMTGLAIDLHRTVDLAMAPSTFDLWVRVTTQQQRRNP
jgi:hypothetical protein